MYINGLPSFKKTYIFLEMKSLICIYMGRGFPGGSHDKESICNAGDPGLILGQEDPLEKEMSNSSTFA